jgi:hypothetical protein
MRVWAGVCSGTCSNKWRNIRLYDSQTSSVRQTRRPPRSNEIFQMPSLSNAALRSEDRRTKGVSLGPQIKASHVKKSDSDIGPFRKRGTGCQPRVIQGSRFKGMVPAVNMPSGEPGKIRYWRCISEQVVRLRSVRPDLRMSAACIPSSTV